MENKAKTLPFYLRYINLMLKIVRFVDIVEQHKEPQPPTQK